MTVDLDAAIKSAVADIVAAAPCGPSLDELDTASPALQMRLMPLADRRRRTSRAMVSAAAATVALGIAAVALVGSRPDGVEPTGQSTRHRVPALVRTLDAPEPGSVVPGFADPPDVLGEILLGQREGGTRTGYWTVMSIGQDNGLEIDHPITIMIFDGTWESLEGASRVTVEGRDYWQATLGSVEVLARRLGVGGVTIAVSGDSDLELLTSVVDSVDADTDQRPYAASVDLPDGYSVVAPLRELANDPTPRPTLVAMDGTLVINEVSDWVDPLSYATSTGTDVQRETVNGTTAWSGVLTSSSYGDLTFVAWAPQPNVVFEIVSTDPAISREALATIAEAVVASTG